MFTSTALWAANAHRRVPERRRWMEMIAERIARLRAAYALLSRMAALQATHGHGGLLPCRLFLGLTVAAAFFLLERGWAKTIDEVCAYSSSQLPHLHRDSARPSHICPTTGLSPATSVPWPSERFRHRGCALPGRP